LSIGSAIPASTNIDQVKSKKKSYTEAEKIS
jgi:hypothetical protein